MVFVYYSFENLIEKYQGVTKGIYTGATLMWNSVYIQKDVPVATFILPENCWTEYYYTPQTAVRDKFLEKYAGKKMVEGFVAFGREEEELYRKYKEYYGYVFYIGKKI